LANAGVGGIARGGFVELLGLHFHEPGVALDGLDAEGLGHPDGLSPDEAADVVASDERDMLAETGLEHLKQAMPMGVFLAAHEDKFFGLVGEVLAEAVGEVGIDAGVFLFHGDGEGEDFALI